jgi:hypothetical protein
MRSTRTRKAPSAGPSSVRQRATKATSAAEHRKDISAAAVEGGLLALTPLGVVGWGWDPQSPAQPLHVMLAANDSVVGAGLANRFDLDLVRSRVGPGIPGFVINLSQPPTGSYPIRLTLRDRAGREFGTPLVVVDESAFERLMPATAMGPYEGMIDGLKDGALVGWARGTTQPESALVVELYDGTERLARQRAQLARDDLDLAGKGKCGFAFDLPVTLLDDRAHSLRVVIGGTNLELNNGPVQFGPLAASRLFDEVTRLRQETDRLRALVETVVDPSGKVQFEIIRTLSERIGAFATVQRDMLERELDALRTLSLREDHSSVYPATGAAPALRASGTSAAVRHPTRHKVA